MPSFKYQARARDGSKKNGTTNAVNEQEALQALSNQGLVVIKMQKQSQLLSFDSENLKGMFQPKVSAIDLALMARQFGAMYNAGVPVSTIFLALSEQTQNKTLKTTLDTVRQNVHEGRAIAVAMADHPKVFPKLMINIIRVGEVSGALDESLDRLSEFYTREHELAQKIKTAMYYPMAVGVMAVIVTWIMLTRVVPTFTEAFMVAGAELPLPTRMLVRLSEILQSYGIFVIMGAVALIVAAKLYGRTTEGRYLYDRLKLKMPVFGRLGLLNALSRYSRILATLMRTGVPILEGLDLVAQSVGNVVLGDRVLEQKEYARQGKSIVTPLAQSPYFPPMLVQMMAVGEETGNIDDMLERVADFYDRDLANMTERLTALMEPLITVVLAVIVGGILVAIVTPMFEMLQHIN